MAPRRVLLSFRKVCSAAVTVALVVTAFWIAGQTHGAPGGKTHAIAQSRGRQAQSGNHPGRYDTVLRLQKGRSLQARAALHNLSLTGDFNNDGLTDLVLFDNSHGESTCCSSAVTPRKPPRPTADPPTSTT